LEGEEEMKKKLVLSGMILGICVGLCACGNPLKQLPEANEENIYNADDETTGNEAGDEILDYLEDESAYKGKVIGFVVYDRDDNEETKEKSEVSVALTTETENAEYIYHFVVTCKYDKDKGWRVKEYEMDSKEKTECMPKAGIDVDMAKEDMIDYVYSYYGEDFSCYFTEESIVDCSVLSDSIEVDDDGYVTDNAVVSVSVEGDYFTATGTLNMEYCFDKSYDEWYLDDYEFNEDFTIEYSEEVLEQLSDEIMMADVAEKEFTLFNYDYPMYFSSDMFSSYEFSEYQFSGNYCYRDLTYTIANTESFSGTLTFNIGYYDYDDGNGYVLDYCQYDYDISPDNLPGDYSAVVYTAGTTDKEGEIYYTITDVGNGECSGSVKWVPEGANADSVEPVTFTGTINSYYISLSFDEKVYYGLGSFDYCYYDYLYFDFGSGQLISQGYDRYYSLEKAE